MWRREQKHTCYSFSCILTFKKAPSQISDINLIFPVRGHYFLPADRVFGLIEKTLRKQSEIVTPDKYRDIYKDVGTVKILAEDWDVRNYKELTSVFKNNEGIKEMKRVFLIKS